MTSAKEKKQEIIASILENPVYTQDSRLIESLSNCLSVMSAESLGYLKMIIGFKLEESRETTGAKP